MTAALDQAMYTPQEVAVACRMPYRTVIERIKDGTIPSQKFGRLYKIPAWWVREQQGSPAPVLHVVPETSAPVVSGPDYGPLASVLEILGAALVQAADALRRSA